MKYTELMEKLNDEIEIEEAVKFKSFWSKLKGRWKLWKNIFLGVTSDNIKAGYDLIKMLVDTLTFNLDKESWSTIKKALQQIALENPRYLKTVAFILDAPVPIEVAVPMYAKGVGMGYTFPKRLAKLEKEMKKENLIEEYNEMINNMSALLEENEDIKKSKGDKKKAENEDIKKLNYEKNQAEKESEDAKSDAEKLKLDNEKMKRHIEWTKEKEKREKEAEEKSKGK